MKKILLKIKAFLVSCRQKKLDRLNAKYGHKFDLQCIKRDRPFFIPCKKCKMSLGVIIENQITHCPDA